MYLMSNKLHLIICVNTAIIGYYSRIAYYLPIYCVDSLLIKATTINGSTGNS